MKLIFCLVFDIGVQLFCAFAFTFCVLLCQRFFMVRNISYWFLFLEHEQIEWALDLLFGEVTRS